jgi:hypothetical protein
MLAWLMLGNHLVIDDRHAMWFWYAPITDCLCTLPLPLPLVCKLSGTLPVQIWRSNPQDVSVIDYNAGQILGNIYHGQLIEIGCEFALTSHLGYY